MFFSDTTQYAKYLNGTEFDLLITVTGALIGGSNYYQFKVHCPKCVFASDSVGHVVAQNESIVVDMPFECLFDAVDGYDVKITMVNTKSTAY
jgi:hypothetical protein